MNVGQTIVSTGVTVRQPLVVEPHQVQDRGVQIVNVHRFFNRLKTKLIGRPVGRTPLHSTPGKDHRKPG